ncbi:MAG: hypothetical protein ICV78_22915 [Tolypothrix sp. Co-bin9]|nr:hypothetical protein [Tolypothrix sp. Co-bin9]
MTVKVYIWKGTNPDLSVYNVRGDVGHVSIQICNETKLNNTVYVSHRPGGANPDPESTDSASTSPNPPRRNSKDLLKYAMKPPAEREKNITFEYECNVIRKREPDVTIEIKGLDETRMRELWQEYDSNKLEISKYHIKTSNCSKAVATFLQAGLKCPRDKICPFCAPNHNVGKRRPGRLWKLAGTTGLIVFVVRSCFSSGRYEYEQERKQDYYNKIEEQFQHPVDPNTGYRRIELPPSNQFDGFSLLLGLIALAIGFLWFLSVLFDIELFSAGWTKGKLWSPQTVEIFGNKVREHASQQPEKLCKRKRFLFF